MGRLRGFSRDWYKSYQWLEYSVERDAAFCFPCRMFKVGSSRCESTFTVTGFHNWKHAMGQKGIITSHDKCDVHKQAMIDWKQYKINMQHHTSVQDRNNSVCSQQIRHNRHYIKTIAKVLRLCAMQDLALRGHREGEDYQNPGNFLKILELIGNHDSVVGEKLWNGPQNATYTSPEVQNSVLQIMGEMLRSQICVEIKKASVFSLLVDETKDASESEQLAIVFRYVDESASIHKRFLTFVPAETLNAEGLSNLIIKTLKEYHIDPMLMVSQRYDGAAVMSGHCSGVQARIRQVASKALYVHCNAHCLNLCLVDCTKSVSCAAEFFGLVQNMYVFPSSSKCHAIYVSEQSRLYPGKSIRQLQRLSDTRWACRQSAINTICYTFDAVVAALIKITGDDDGSRVAEARGLLLQVKSFKFILLLVIFDRLLTCSKGLSDILQSTKIDLGKAGDLITATIEIVEIFRSDSEWEKVLAYSKNVAEKHDVSLESPAHSHRTREPPRRYDDGFIYASTGSRGDGMELDYKVLLYYPILDCFLAELKQRFTDKNQEIMKAIHACQPTSNKFLEMNELQPIIDQYNLNHDYLIAETTIAKRVLKDKKLEDISDVVTELVPLKEALPCLLELLQISLTISVSTAKCERSFSTLKRSKSYLRSTMSEKRLNNMAILSIEHDLCQKLDLEAVVTEFAKSNWRIALN